MPKDAKSFLQQVEKLDIQIKNKLIEKEQWKDTALGIVSGGESVVLERKGKKELHNMEKVQSTGRPSKMADAIDKCIDMEAEIDALIDKLIDTKARVIATIEQIENPMYYNILHLRYIQYKTLWEISGLLNKDYQSVKQAHSRAKKAVQAILDRRE